MENWKTEAQEMCDAGHRSFLFLCVANSARSQLGEGVARYLASKLPASKRQEYTFYSAGSEPTQVRPEARMALAEWDIDTSGHFSKNVSEIDPAKVDVVITLCAEEECPVFLGDAVRVHWPLPDPASDEGTVEGRVPAFRDVRDELQKRLKVVLGQ